MNKLVFVAMAAIFAMPVATAFAQNATTTTGSVQIVGTCGIGSLAPINYGMLAPSQVSAEQILDVFNTGTVPGQLLVQGSDWESASFVSQIFVGNTRFGVTSTPSFGPAVPAPPIAGQESVLAYAYQPITFPGNFAVGSNLTFWQVWANLSNSTFTGTLTQTYNFTATC